ncbi:DUF421 domain-containing protein [Mycolicibacterium sp. 120266]|uniref:DUF421 domain-containing protein n=1 Tax=Mycolicibacterium sp. 120266 TaxID=3090601 RepID=UPI00299D29C7|nr:YetF domain-containing protein [Mycolicibacterium sp. 120266]MDX1875373.1 DUF421 domain-containing protein [Mycolicibacterium sp. 120266]
MADILRALIGDLSALPGDAVKTCALFVSAAALFRFTERRTLAEFAPFDWVAAVAAGSIVGRAATASDTSWVAAAFVLGCLLLTHSVLTRLRFVPRLGRLIDPPPRILIRDGTVLQRNVRRCGLTRADLQALLRQHGHLRLDHVRLAVFEAKGAVSVLAIADRTTACPEPADSEEDW